MDSELATMIKFGRIAKDPRFERLPCAHKGTYADDCLVDRVTEVIMLISFLCFYKEILML